MIRSGEIKNWAEAARLVGVTRARMTQITNLLLLAPEIQEMILWLRPAVENPFTMNERNLRSAVRVPEWDSQRPLRTPGLLLNCPSINLRAMLFCSKRRAPATGQFE
jgi:hypothetical protein